MALILGMVSCQNDFDDTNVIVGGEQEVTVTVAIPEAETRADADWNFSKEGAFKNVVGSDAYTIRYIFDVYYGEDRAERQVKYSDDQSVAFGVRLVPEREYSFVVWADVVEQTDREENAWSNNDNAYYNTEHLHAITLKDTWNAMDETRDAFTGVHTETNYTGSSNITISLTRPFAKLRVVTTDFDELAKFGIEAKYATVAYTTPYVSEFNALEGKAVAAAENGPTKTHTKYAIKSYADETGDEHTIFSDYIFTTDPAGVVKLNMEVFEEDMTKRIKANSFNTDIQVRPNYITTLKGDVLTTGGNVTITVNPGFAQDEIVENYVDTAEDLQDVIDNAADGQETVVVLGGDVDLSELAAGIFSTRAAEPAFGLEIPAGKVVTLDLKGYTISQTKEQTAAYAMILNKGTLTIKDSSANGTGKLSYADSGQGGEYASNTVKNDGVMIIDGGTIENNSSETVAATGYPHPVDNNGVLTINGGTLTNNAHYSSMRIWCTTDDNTIVTINGGTFNGSIDFQTPSAAANKGTLTITGGTFNADTYTKTAVRLLGFGADVDEMNGYISGGFFNGAIALRNWSGSEFNSQVFYITGGTFTTAAKEATDEALLDEDYTWIEAENGLWTLGLKPAVAKIGEVEYKSLQKAFDAGGEVTLLCDVNLAETVVLAEGNTATLDLNGKTIDVTYNESTSKHIYALDNYGTLTIKDSKGTGKIVARGMYNRDGAKLTINEAEVVGADWNGGACVWGYGTSELYLNNATLVGNTGCVSSEGYIEINGGTYTCYSGIDDNGTIITSPTYNIRAYNGLKITNGDFTSRHGVISIGGGEALLENGNYTIKFAATTTSNVVYIYGTANVDIKGGKYISDNSANKADSGAAVLVSGSDASLNIYDGEFVGMNGMVSGNATLYGGKYNTVWDYNHYDKLENLLAKGYKAEQDENGAWIVVVDPVAKIGDVEYETLEAAVAAAEEGATITLLKDVKPTNLPVLKNITLAGSGQHIDATIEGDNLTIAGHVKVTKFNGSNYNRNLTIIEGGCLEITGGDRISLAFGNTWNITGSIEDAKTADKANIKPSLIIPGGISITGGSNAALNVTNAYVSFGNTSSKNSSANGVFTLNFTNSIVDFTNQFTLSAPTGGKTPTFNVNITNSVLTTDTKLCLAAPASNVVVDNSILNLKTYFRNSGKFELKNGSVMTGATIQFGENGGNDGAITVDNSSFSINCGNSTGSAFDGKGKGSITATNGATVAVQYYKDMAINVDATSTFTGTDIYGNRKIHYVSEEMKLEPTNPDALGGATIVSNVWDKTTGKGVITFDRDLTTIGDKAFQRITNTTPSDWVTSITLPASVTTIGDFAFYMCFSLKTVTIPESVRSIGQYAFGSCYDLVEINCQPTTPPTLGYGAFNNVSATCYVPTGSVDTYKANWSEYDGNIEGREF